jgi:hypothetical protein
VALDTINDFYIGADPGANGGVVIMNSYGAFYAVKNPLTVYDCAVFIEDLRTIVGIGGNYHVYMEDVHAVGHDRSNKAFSFGHNVAILHLSLVLAFGHVNLVSPQLWQRHYPTGIKASFDKKGHKRALKEQAADIAGHRLKITGWNADAFLLACYAYHKSNNVGSN